jgi:hypothetical protein
MKTFREVVWLLFLIIIIGMLMIGIVRILLK